MNYPDPSEIPQTPKTNKEDPLSSSGPQFSHYKRTPEEEQIFNDWVDMMQLNIVSGSGDLSFLYE